ncbi:MAG TPA: M20/M25/M40 family metallo-hydrolase [Gemmatimonadaceae bacterium]
MRESFTYSQFPARFGPFICGLIFAAGMYLAGHLASSRAAPVAGIACALSSAALAGIAGSCLLKHTLSMPLNRAAGVNLVAKRGSSEPSVWVVAHLDSKSQTIRMLLRIGSIAVAWIFFILTLGTMVAQVSRMSVAAGYAEQMLALESGIGSLLTGLAILPLAFCFIRNESPGALDNATGVASVLLALKELSRDRNVGVLFTSAEELGLAGARAFVASHGSKAIVINCDTVDDDGRFVCMTSDKRSRTATAIAKAGNEIGHSIKIRGMIRGILTDSIPFDQTGWEAVTVSRGNLRTLAVVHTSGDEPARLNGAGVALAARLIAATVEELA